ncbi:GerW family sporulation protein [Dehalobacter sp. DCM]|uniref:GerW family sporulation protein n=1 Tax=Dehalobacter sp. DCM TaxID=2907827 RepID=UPI0030815826|nr:GerW family sporulation protein [Dehalobacter sp. DCM]
MEEHPIENLMQTAMDSIQKMINVNTVIGDPVETPNGSVIIPVSRVSCGFAAGGSEFSSAECEEAEDKKDEGSSKMPFGGGSGGGVSVKPVGFLVVSKDHVRLLPVEGNVIADRLIDEMPNLMDKFSQVFSKRRYHRESCEDRL